MISKESLEAKYYAARELDDNKAYCEYLDAVEGYSKLKQLIESEDFWKNKMKMLEDGRKIIGYQKPLSNENKNKYRNGLDKLQEELVKLQEADERHRAKLISNLKWVIGVIMIPIIIALVVYTLSVKYPDIAITQASMSDVYIRGINYTTPALTFTATAVGERDVRTGVNFSIVLINQSRTCGNATFFYYSKREICQYNISSALGEYHKACGFSSIAPLTLGSPPQNITVTQDIVNHEVNHFLNETKKTDIAPCEINASIEVCSSYECNGQPNCLKNCSGAFPVSIRYNSS